MPRRADLRSIALIGSGPIVIGQASEFDYAGCQALKVLRADGFRTIVVNSNPATIMTDPGFADRTYLEPLDLEGVAAALERERPDALLPTMGGQTALNLARELAESGILGDLGVELIGAPLDVIERAEDRRLFKRCVESVGLRVPTSSVVTSVEQLDGLTVPAVVRPAFTLGGHGGGFAETEAELRAQVERGLRESPIGQVLVEESLRGWDEFELELMRDRADNCVVVCSIENLDPMGVHTGDSVTVAPQLTLPDEDYHRMRDAAIAVMRAVGVDCGGSNIQFARERSTGELRVIEMNPRVSRSSALASKATGYPIAKVAAQLAVGYTLDEIANDLTGTTPASFEPTLDYVVVKFPRFAFEKFPGADTKLGTQMKSVGETMGIGRTFPEAFLKARRSLEQDIPWEWRPHGLHPWFERELARVDDALDRIESVDRLSVEDWLKLKRLGVADEEIAAACDVSEQDARRARLELGVRHSYRLVDSVAGEVEARSNYFYSTWGEADDPLPGAHAKPTVVILGSGPNRIAQGIEFDYCCVHAAQSFRELGFEAVIVNCNPETVSTDYDTSDRLYFEPLRTEEVLAICEREQPVGVVIQFGGQTPLKLARPLEQAGYRILGTPFDAVDLAEDRARFAALAESVGIAVPEWGSAGSPEVAIAFADRIGYPVLARPSYVLGGRAMRICHDHDELREAVADTRGPVLIDRFLVDAVEFDVDAVCDGRDTYVAAVMQHVEHAGVHSGDSACVLPAPELEPERELEIRAAVRRLGRALGVRGLFNVQFAVAADELYVLEANPRASRTVPFVSKARGINLVDAACRVAAGADLASLELPPERAQTGVSVKAAVLPFVRLPGSDPLLGPEMRATGEVMVTAADFPTAFAKAERAARRPLPASGTALFAVGDRDAAGAAEAAARLAGVGLDIAATLPTARALRELGVQVAAVTDTSPLGEEGFAAEQVRQGRFALVVSTAPGAAGAELRSAAVAAGVPCYTTIAGARAAAAAMSNGARGDVVSLQERIENIWADADVAAMPEVEAG